MAAEQVYSWRTQRVRPCFSHRISYPLMAICFLLESHGIVDPDVTFVRFTIHANEFDVPVPQNDGTKLKKSR